MPTQVGSEKKQLENNRSLRSREVNLAYNLFFARRAESPMPYIAQGSALGESMDRMRPVRAKVLRFD